MNLRDLKYLVAVAEHQHFGKAAKQCFVSQPALSMQLKKLEDTLGVQLFERTNKHVMVTQVGEEIVARAHTIIQDTEALVEVAKTHQRPFSTPIHLGAFPTLAPYLLPKIVPDLTKSYPDLTLLLVEEKTHILIEQLEKGSLDIALLALPIAQENFTTIELFQDEFLLAVPPKHPLAAKSAITFCDIQKESLLLLEEGHCLRDQALDVCRSAGVSEPTGFRATSLETLRQMVLAGVGITLIPKLAQRKNDGLVYIPFGENKPYRSIGIVWRPTSPRSECYEMLAQNIKNYTTPA